MQTYPSIEKDIVKGVPIYAFDKLDGSNIVVEWSKKRKFWKFGSRKQLINKNNKLLGESIELIKSKYEKDLHDIFVKEKYLKVNCYFEFYGKSSFAGNHYDEEHNVTLFDISVRKKGMLEPRDFLKLTRNMDVAKLLYHGNANELLVEEVKNGTLEGMTFEGVVCKGSYISPGRPLMFKIKNQAWINRLKGHCKEDSTLYEKLA